MTSQTTGMVLAVQKVPQLKNGLRKMEERMILLNRTKATFRSYGSKVAQICLRFSKLPEDLTQDEINSYLTGLLQSARSYSRSEFKHVVYGLRFYFKSLDREDIFIKLPSIKKEVRLPVVLSKEECIKLFGAYPDLKKRLMLMFMYSAGLRAAELTNLKLCDVDWNRMLIHIKRAKGNKDRYVPLAHYLLLDIKKYLEKERPVKFMFCTVRSGKLSTSRVRDIMRAAVKKAGILKDGVCLHTLRHSYATHLLEDGLDIVSIKDLLGHAYIEATMVYLHVARCERVNKFSPLDRLMGEFTRNDKEEKENIDAIIEITKKAQQTERRVRSQLRLFEND